MRINRAGLLLGLSALALAIPVLAQQSGPESLLPPGFGDQPAPPQTPPPARGSTPATPPRGTTPPATTTPTPLLPDQASIDRAAETLAGAENGTENVAAADEIAEKYDLPSTSRRSLDVIGPLTADLGGFEGAAFGQSNGRALARVMEATRAPFMSRWASILARRALISHVDTPTDINGADWVAERAWLLLRMGEADNARLLVQHVDSDQFTKRLYSVAMQVQLATADPSGFCPLLPRARDFSDAPGWFMAQAICASFSADQGSASALLNQAQRRGIARGIDYRLAEKVVGAGPSSRRSVKIEWDGVATLTSWRYGLATATNVEIPAALFGTVGPQVRAWQARAANLSYVQRRPGVAVATRLGVFSGSAALGFQAALAAQDDADTQVSQLSDYLQAAYAGDSVQARINGMRDYWQTKPADDWSADAQDVYYGALPAIARAAATLPATADAGDDAPWIIAATLSGGYDRSAARWASALGSLSGESQQRSWALLAAGLPDPRIDLSADRINAFVSSDETEGRRIGHSLVAVLAGLDRLPVDGRAELIQQSGLDMTARRPWARAIMAAAARREQGTVALLAAVGMQGQGWQSMTPQLLYFIVAALHDVGLDPYARMIAAEAMARL